MGCIRSAGLSLIYGACNVEVAAAWVDQIYPLVRTGLRILGTDDGAVDAAFDWMHEADGQGPAP